MGNDQNGVMLGFQLSTGGGGARLRLVYPTGTVLHEIPKALFDAMSQHREDFESVLAGRERAAKFGHWMGPQ
jgi:hypothetical protein